MLMPILCSVALPPTRAARVQAAPAWLKARALELLVPLANAKEPPQLYADLSTLFVVKPRSLIQES